MEHAVPGGQQAADPKEWADLAKPVYFSHVAVSSPSRSGTTHLTVETILQGEGWNKGWAQLLAISGNSAAITERSFGVPDGVSNGQFGIGLVIDFFGLAAKNSGMPVEFVYPSVTAIVPANIALIAGAKSPEGGKRFIQFTLSEEGQMLLLQKDISRLPVMPAIYSKAPAGYPNPFSGSIQAKVNFDTELSESRYYVVVSLFDQMITFRHKELAQATKAIGMPRSASGARRIRSSTRREAHVHADRGRQADRRQGAARAVQGRQEGRDGVEAEGQGRGGVGVEGQGQLRKRRGTRQRREMTRVTPVALRNSAK